MKKDKPVALFRRIFSVNPTLTYIKHKKQQKESNKVIDLNDLQAVCSVVNMDGKLREFYFISGIIK